MSLFLSTFTNKIDKKGRVSVPSAYRALLSNESFNGIIVYASFINECIEACGMQRIIRMNEIIDTLDPYSEERDAFAATILGGSIQLGFDSEGRVILPNDLIESVQLEDQACFVGKGATFEIWNPKLFTEYINRAKILAKERRSALSLSQGGSNA